MEFQLVSQEKRNDNIQGCGLEGTIDDLKRGSDGIDLV